MTKATPALVVPPPPPQHHKYGNKEFNSIQFNISLLPFLIQVKIWNFSSAETLYKLNSITNKFR
jgi:hypothetical protein